MTAPERRDSTEVGPVLVTGASGFIGRHVCESFVAGGATVVGLARRPGSLAAGVRPAPASDLLEREAIRRALGGVETVIHLAGRAHAKPEGKHDPASECQRLNVDGTKLLLEEAASAGVRRFILISTVKAVAEESDNALDETTPPLPVDAYGKSKLEAERLVRVFALREGMHAPILRLPLVYGPGIKSNMLRLFAAVDRGLPLPFGSVHNRRSFAYVGNVTEAIRAVLRTPAAAAETFFVSDREDMSTPELIRRIAHSLSRKPRLVGVPVAALRAMAGAGYLLSRITPFHFTSESLTALVGSLFVDISKLQSMTAYRTPVSVAEGLAMTASWFRTGRSAAAR